MDANPYESPREINEFPDPGVGSWRDGNLLVMNINADLLPFCIHTNQPAAGAREFFLTWRPPGSLFSQTNQLWLPQVGERLQQYARERRAYQASWWLVVGSFVGLIVGFPYITGPYSEDWIPAASRELIGNMVALICITGGLVGAVRLFLAYSSYRPPVTLVHTWQDFVWFGGVHPGFLHRLPEWPGPSQFPPD